MEPTEPVEALIARALAEHLPVTADEALALLQSPPTPDMGDYGLPCFTLAAALRRAPAAIAAQLQEQVALPPGVREARADGPYLNFFVDRPAVTAAVLRRIIRQADSYGRSDAGAGARIVVEYSSPNIAKHLGVHHLRSAIIGGALCRLFEFLGYEAVGLNFLGDWGTGFGKLIAAFERYCAGDASELSVSDLQDLYVRFSAEAGEDPGLEQAARDAFRRLEEGESAARRLWDAFKRVSLDEFERIYRMLGISFDRYTPESDYIEQIPGLLQRVRESGAARESEGALIVPLADEDLPPLMLQKSDGSSLYATRDLCAAEHRWDEFRFERSLYVVGNEQALHFDQLKAVLRGMGCPWADRMEHVSFGLMKFRDAETGRARKGSTRGGEMLLLDDVLREAVERAAQKLHENADRLEEDAPLGELAAQIGIGAVIFSDLSTRRARDVLFDWDKVLDFEGATGPYVQYAHARLCSILRKADRPVPPDVDFALLALPEEWALVRQLGDFPRRVRRAAADCEPFVIVGYLLDLCAEFSTYYSAGMREPARRVLCPDRELSAARLLLTQATRHVIRNGLRLLGMSAPERM